MLSSSHKIRDINYWYAIISVAMVLVLIGFFGILLIQTSGLLTVLKENVNIIIELKDEIEESDIVAIQYKLNNTSFVKPNSVRLIPKEKALELLREDFGEDFMKLDIVNPFYNSLLFNVKAEYLESEKLEKIRLKIMDNIVVRDVYYQESMIDVVANNLSKIAWLGLGLGLFFVLIAIFLIHNTMQLALHSNRFLIKNMELVGASWEFISRPFIMRSIRNGLMSAIIAIVVLLMIFYWLNHQMSELQLIDSPTHFLLLWIGVIVLGVGISTISTYLVVHRYLKMRLDDLY